MIEQYNEIVIYSKENDLVTTEDNGKEKKAIYGSLARSSIDDEILTTIRGAISGASVTDASSVAIFADLGVTTEKDGTLKFDEKVFRTAITNDSQGTQTLITSFADLNGATGGVLHQYTQFQGLFDDSVDVNDQQIRDLNQRISDAESIIAKLEEQLVARFARLEALMGKMQGQQNALSGALGGLK